MIKAIAKTRAWVGLLGILLLASAAIGESKWVKPGDVDFKSLLPATAPSADSDQTKREIEQLLILQQNRTPADVARCASESTFSVFAFADTVGPWFTAKNLPVTAAMMTQVKADTKAVFDQTKGFYGRMRPFLIDSRIQPCVKLESSYSFPSGHSMYGTIDAMILARMMPDKAVALEIRGEQIGSDRLLAGEHFPSDVAAGRVLGAAIAQKILDNPDFGAELEKATAECKPFIGERVAGQ